MQLQPVKQMKPIILALDLEGTLISNAVSQIPRPGLSAFLEQCRQLFSRIVMFTSVDEARFRQIAKRLVEDGEAPDWLAEIEYITWTGHIKDLTFVPNTKPSQILLVDDFERYIHPAQVSQWIPIDCFQSPYSPDDTALEDCVQRLQARVNAPASSQSDD